MKKNTILIADDVALNREMLTEMLGDKYDFVYASNGVEVIDALHGDKTIELILLDLNMPVMDGYEVLRIMNERHWIEEVPVIIISAEDSTESINRAYEFGIVDYINRPFRAIVVRSRVENTLSMYTNQERLVRLFNEQVYEKEKINNAMINIFSNLIESRNHESGSHTLNVQVITRLLLQCLVKMTDKYDLTESKIALISSLAALHDIGKIKVPDNIINKPGKLTAEEWEIMKSHTTKGDRILSNPFLDQRSEFVKTAREIVRHHHEKYNGKGYPDGLVGDEIPISAQAVSIADVYDALTSERCYKVAFSHEKSIQMILDGECGTFNPLLLECLKQVSSQLKELKQSGKTYDYQDEAAHVADELLIDNQLPKANGMRRMMDNERLKKDFFMSCAKGLQFEYDALLGKTAFVYIDADGTPSRKIRFTSMDDKENVLPPEYWKKIGDCLDKTNHDKPTIEMDVKLRLDGKLVPCHANLLAIWPEDGSRYISVVGHFEKKQRTRKPNKD
jgi:response regulator RpfG family c-di-GMP phosphodiesterase